MLSRNDSDRKKKILEHLAKSSDLLKTPTVKPSVPLTTESVPPSAPITSEPEPTPSPTVTKTSTVSKSESRDTSVAKDARKRQILAHLNQSSSEFGEILKSDEPDKKRIQEHLRKSIS
ncbi:MAG: hypothetical protein VKJ02_09950 [Snowella sp.]|nr:hypothetical protein [Snowella sp.]